MHHALANLRLLVVEDEILIASELASALEAEGATVIGPATTLAQGYALRRSGGRIDGAVLDINLRGLPVFPLADELDRLHVRFLFTTGYDERAIPDRFADVPHCEKPMDVALLVKAVSQWLAPPAPDRTARMPGNICQPPRLKRRGASPIGADVI